MKVTVDQDVCISCGACVDTCPDVFAFNEDGKSSVLVDEIPAGHQEHVKDAIEGCPVEAISEV